MSKPQQPNPQPQYLGKASTISDGGRGLRFKLETSSGEVFPAFVVQFDGQAYAYLNRCGHIAVQLDYMPGEFFSDDGQTLVCSTHGAEYAPDTGACLGGPCYGIGLDALEITQTGDDLYLASDTYTVVAQD